MQSTEPSTCFHSIRGKGVKGEKGGKKKGIDKNTLLQTQQYTDKYTTDKHNEQYPFLHVYIYTEISISVYTQNIFTYIPYADREVPIENELNI